MILYFTFHENISFIMKVYPGIILANGNTVKELALVKKLRVTHILNAAEGHVRYNKDRKRKEHRTIRPHFLKEQDQKDL